MAKTTISQRWYRTFVAWVALFTVCAWLVLCYALLPSLPLATGVALGGLLLFGLPIAWFVWDTRHRLAELPREASSPITQITIALKTPVARLRSLWLPVGLTWLGLMVVLNGLFALSFDEVDVTRALLLFDLVWLSMGGLVMWVLEAPQKKARALSVSRPPLLQISEDGLRVPFELLTRPAYDIALKRGVSDLQLNWEDIEAIEVHAARGRSPQQYAMKTRGAAAEWGGLLGHWGIIRSEEVLEQENRVLEAFRKKLAAALRIHHG